MRKARIWVCCREFGLTLLFRRTIDVQRLSCEGKADLRLVEGRRTSPFRSPIGEKKIRSQARVREIKENK